jgi:hypothetical protein
VFTRSIGQGAEVFSRQLEGLTVNHFLPELHRHYAGHDFEQCPFTIVSIELAPCIPMSGALTNPRFLVYHPELPNLLPNSSSQLEILSVITYWQTTITPTR